MPQITGGLELIPVTEKESVMHWVARLSDAIPPGANTPFIVDTLDWVKVLGPEMTNDEKSSRSWNFKFIFEDFWQKISSIFLRTYLANIRTTLADGHATLSG